MPIKTVFSLSHKLILQADNNLNSETEESAIMILLNIAIRGLYIKDFDLISLVLPAATKLTALSSNYQYKLIAKYIDAMSEINDGSIDSGTKKIEQVIETMKYLGDDQLAMTYQSFYHTFMKNGD